MKLSQAQRELLQSGERNTQWPGAISTYRVSSVTERILVGAGYIEKRFEIARGSCKYAEFLQQARLLAAAGAEKIDQDDLYGARHAFRSAEYNVTQLIRERYFITPAGQRAIRP